MPKQRPITSTLLKPKATLTATSHVGSTVKPANDYPILVITHPVSACGSADFNLGGDGLLSQSYREGMIEQFNLARWRDRSLVVSLTTN